MKRKGYVITQFWSLQSMIGWPHCLWRSGVDRVPEEARLPLGQV